MIFLTVPFSAAAVAEEAPVPGDFAYGLRLHLPEGGAIYRVSLPAAVYRGVTRTDLGDLRVFNADGRPVPHTVRRPPRPEATGPPRSVPFFPLFAAGSDGEGLMLQITTNAAGAVVRTTPRPGKGGDDRVAAYLIDLGPPERSAAALRLDWSAAGESFVADVALSGGDDLNQWHSLAPSTTLARLRYGGHRLERNTIPLPPNPPRYLRLSWPAETGSARLSAVRAEPTPSGPAPRRVSVRGTLDVAAPADWFFDLGGPLPTDQVQLELAEINSLVQGALYSRADPEAEWRYRGEGMFYRLRIDGEEVAGAPVDLSTRSGERYWRFSPSENAGAEVAPALVVSYTPHELLLLARGTGPFLLAYGAATMAPADRPVAELIRTLDDGGSGREIATEARLGEAVTLGGSEALTPPPPLRRWLLWSVLVAGVGLIAGMAWHLWRQMDAGPGTGG
jgi:hypothetical protein